MNSSKVGNEIKMKWIAFHNTETKRFANYMHKSAHVCVHCLLLYCTSTNDIQWHNHKEVVKKKKAILGDLFQESLC